jgi:hypothetical protein
VSRAIALALPLVAAAGCHLIFGYSTGASDVRPPDAEARLEGLVGEASGLVPVELQRSLDVLVVVDNSNSMEPKQQQLAKAFGAFVDELARRSAGLPEIHIGVVSTDLGAGVFSLPSCEKIGGDAGLLQNAPCITGCTPPNAPWIAYAAGASNVPGDVAELEKIKTAFHCIASLGTGGCGFEQPLAASRLALQSANPAFVRPGADLLAVLYVTDEDDCSAKDALFDPSTPDLGAVDSFRCFRAGVKCAESADVVGPHTSCGPAPASMYFDSVDGYVQFFQKLKPGRVVLGAIAGPVDSVQVQASVVGGPVLASSCIGLDTAVPAIRLKAVIDQISADGWGKQGICASTFESDLVDFARAIGKRMPPACVRVLPPGKLVCEVHDQHPSGALPEPIAECSGCAGCRPCWQLAPHADCASDEVALEIVRQDPLAGGGKVVARCGAL